MESRFFNSFISLLFLTIYGNKFSDHGAHAAADGHWNYRDTDKWGEYCQVSKKQSPINIKLENTFLKNYPPFKFDKHYTDEQKFWSKNTGHTIQFQLQSKDITPAISGGGLEGKFFFEQAHFHWESEHEFEGKKADLELHMVHYNTKYKNLAEALDKPDGIAVFAVFFDTSEERRNDKFLDYVKNAVDLQIPSSSNIQDIGQVNLLEERGVFALRQLLPEDVAKFFRYDGSLTTPNCNEGVQWTLFTNRFFVSNATLAALRSLKDTQKQEIRRNYRPVQSLNGRKIYMKMSSDYNSKSSNYSKTSALIYFTTFLQIWLAQSYVRTS